MPLITGIAGARNPSSEVSPSGCSAQSSSPLSATSAINSPVVAGMMRLEPVSYTHPLEKKTKTKNTDIYHTTYDPTTQYTLLILPACAALQLTHLPILTT
ncbi:MAG: hypothetical protein MPK62_12940, partial [Alphaproteobacteria bacterium]|nr:hypothetical protein [Alphaproteobacteria bacterium]